MAKQKSLIKIEGTVDGVTFYRNSEGHYVRMAGGVSKKRIMNDPAFARTRENISEFGYNAKAAKFLRNSAGIMINRAKDARTSNRLMQIFNQIKNLDDTSVRGQRKIWIGLGTPEGKSLLKQFDFNRNAQLKNILKSTFVLEPVSGVFTLSGLIPELHLRAPQGSTHCSMSSGCLLADFETETGTLIQSTTENFKIDHNEVEIELTTAPPAGTGVKFFLLLIEFFQEVNGVQYPLNNGAYNALHVMEVV